MGYDPRIGHAYLAAGLGFGGPCLEKDLRALIKMAQGHGYEPQLLRAVMEQNEGQIGDVIAKLKEFIGYSLRNKIVTVFGLAFKAGTNDVRNSLALKVIDCLEEEGAIVRAHDPVAIPEAKVLRPHLDCYEDSYKALRRADALLVLTEWPCFSELDYREIRECMAYPCIVDARNLLDSVALRDLGFSYVSIGRPERSWSQAARALSSSGFGIRSNPPL